LFGVLPKKLLISFSKLVIIDLMKTGKKILYFLFIVFVFLNIVLFLKLSLLSTSPTIEIINHERRSKYFTRRQ